MERNKCASDTALRILGPTMTSSHALNPPKTPTIVMNENHNQDHRGNALKANPICERLGEGMCVRRKSNKRVISKEQTSSQGSLNFNFSVRSAEARRLSVHEQEHTGKVEL